MSPVGNKNIPGRKIPITRGSRSGRTVPTPTPSAAAAAEGLIGYSSALPLGQVQPNVMAGQLKPPALAPGPAGNLAGINIYDESDSKSGSDNHTGDDDDDHEGTSDQRKRKRRYHRHTQNQIQEMESFFKECPHPDDRQRRELGRELGLKPLQIKFWFQNKRTQLKMQHERHENTQLRQENERLRVENMRYKEVVSNTACPTCGGPTVVGEVSFEGHHLHLENERLRQEVDRMAGMAKKYPGRPMVNYPLGPPPVNGPLALYGTEDITGPNGGGPNGYLDKPMIHGLAVSAMEELIRMAQVDEPLWVPAFDSSSFVVNEEEYFMAFPRPTRLGTTGFKCEASKSTSMVMMSPAGLVAMFMDVNQWSAAFSGIVTRAKTLEVLSIGGANYNGAQQLINAEFQVLSPLVPTRETYFVRYSKHNIDGTWAVVDFSVDSFRPSSMVKCRRRPSGCLILELPNGCSQVTWVEHVEVEDRGVHTLYKPLVNSGLAFGAKRWICTLERQCERIASSFATNLPANDVTDAEGRKGMTKLAERMVNAFCDGVSAATSHTWTILSGSGADDVRVMTLKSIGDPGRPSGIVINASTSFWLPVTPKRVFEFLRAEESRKVWDILSNGGDVEEVAHISNSREYGNCVTLLRVAAASGGHTHMLILQESCYDPTSSFVIYAPVDVFAIEMVMGGGDPDYVALLPSGFSIVPDGPTGHGDKFGEEVGVYGGSLLTVSFQILIDSAPDAQLSLGSVATVNNLITATVARIKSAVERNDL